MLGLMMAAAMTSVDSHAAEPLDAVATHTYNLPAGPLGRTLASFAVKAGIALSFDPALTEGLNSPPLSGTYTVREAMTRLLAGSGLEVVARADSSYTLRKQSADARTANNESVLPVVRVKATEENPEKTEGTGSYTTRSVNTATRLNLSLRETPQSISVITRQQMDDQGLQDIAVALQQTPGISVIQENTSGYAFYSRGFRLQNFEFDGIPSLSTDGGNVRDNYSIANLAIYDRIEILKGATGLINGAGYPSGVLNLVRKRPTQLFRGHTAAGAGSWDAYRAELDLSGPLTKGGKLRGRTVAAAQQQQSFMDYLEGKSYVFYGVLEGDIAPATTASVGYDYQKNDEDGTTNSHLPAFFSDGSTVHFSRSTNAADKWAYRNQVTQRAFADIEHRFSNDWSVKAVTGYRKYTSRELISGMTSGALVNVDDHSATHGFTSGSASLFNTDTEEKTLDLYAKGTYSVLGRTHELVLGFNYAETVARSNRFNGSTDTRIADVFNWDNNATEPSEYRWWLTNDVETEQSILYAATIVNPTDRFSVILGGRVNDYEWSLDSINANNVAGHYSTRVDDKFVPYAGITYDVGDRHTLYASYTDVFKPQAYNFDANDKQLDPMTGESYEIGVKGEYFSSRLNASLALFEIKQDNLAEQDPSGATRPSGGTAYIAIQGTTTRGVELEIGGELQPGWQLLTGYVYQDSYDAYDNRVSTTQPQHLVKATTNYRLPGAWNRLTIGGGLQWQSLTYFTQTISGTPRRFEQDAYGLVSLVAGYDFNKRLHASINLSNLFDEEYYSGIGNYNTVIYGAPRNVMLNVKYDF